MQTVNVKIDGKNQEYPIIIGKDMLSEIYSYIAKYTNAKRFLVVTNTTVKKLYGKYFENENTDFVVLEDGEIYKNIKSYEKILNKACEIKLERKDAIIALGGGVVGDLAGFAAASYLRGVDFIQVPTTLLAMVDSSVGGKTGFNNSFGKNLIGAFYQPKLVFADIMTLSTLDKTQLVSGLGEVIKYGFIEKNCKLPKDINFASYLLENYQDVLDLKDEAVIKVVKTCCEMKSAVVRLDEKEGNLRRILNFGHTIGHAVEKTLNYKGLTHGQAIVLGMKIMFNYAVSMHQIDKMYQQNAFTLMDNLAPVKIVQKINPNTLIEAMAYDKKSVDKKIKFVVPYARREVEITDNVNLDVLKDEIKKFFTI